MRTAETEFVFKVIFDSCSSGDMFLVNCVVKVITEIPLSSYQYDDIVTRSDNISLELDCVGYVAHLNDDPSKLQVFLNIHTAAKFRMRFASSKCKLLQDWVSSDSNVAPSKEKLLEIDLFTFLYN